MSQRPGISPKTSVSCPLPSCNRWLAQLLHASDQVILQRVPIRFLVPMAPLQSAFFRSRRDSYWRTIGQPPGKRDIWFCDHNWIPGTRLVFGGRMVSYPSTSCCGRICIYIVEDGFWSYECGQCPVVLGMPMRLDTSFQCWAFCLSSLSWMGSSRGFRRGWRLKAWGDGGQARWL